MNRENTGSVGGVNPGVARTGNWSTDEERQRRFMSHTINEAQAARIDELRGHFLVMSERIARLVPPGREQATALTNLEQALFFGVAGIARQAQ